MAGKLFYTVFQQRALIWVRQYATLTSHTGDSITDLSGLMNTSWMATVRKYSLVPARCAVFCITHGRQTLSAFQQFLICAVRKVSLWVQPIPVPVVDQSEQTWFNSNASQQPESCLFSLAHLVPHTRKCWHHINYEQQTYCVLGVAWTQMAWGHCLHLSANIV